MAQNLSKVHSHISGRKFSAGEAAVKISAAQVQKHAALLGIGIDIRETYTRNAMEYYGIAMDGNDVGIAPAQLSGITTPSIAAQIQFLQAWLPGFVRAITAARKIDELVGLSTVGAWEDEEIVQGILEPTGTAVPYTDHGNIPLASWNVNFERRTVVRFEHGMEVGKLEELRTARMRISTSSEKRTGAALSLDIQRNRVGFYGYNTGLNRTYGFLNDPSLPAYVTVPNGAGGSPLWSTKTFLEITANLRVGYSALRTQSGDTIDPEGQEVTLALPTNRVDFLSVTSDFGISVRQWIKENYPKTRIVSAPELNDANGGVAVFYMYAEQVNDGASDGSRTWVQAVPTKFITLGVEKRAKVYVEDYSNATAGVMLKRPYAVYRGSGI